MTHYLPNCVLTDQLISLCPFVCVLVMSDMLIVLIKLILHLITNVIATDGYYWDKVNEPIKGVLLN